MRRKQFDPGDLTVVEVHQLFRYLGVDVEFRLLPKIEDEIWHALVLVAGAARIYRDDAKNGRKILLEALDLLDEVQAPVIEDLSGGSATDGT